MSQVLEVYKKVIAKNHYQMDSPAVIRFNMLKNQSDNKAELIYVRQSKHLSQVSKNAIIKRMNAGL